MTNFVVEVGGTQATQIVDVSYESTSGSTIGSARVVVVNSATNRSLFESGADVVIKRENPDNPGSFETDFVGVVQGTPSRSSNRNLTIDVTVESRMSELEYANVNRPFIEMDTGEIIRQAVENVVEPDRQPARIHTGSSTTGWDSDAPIFELADIDKSGLAEYGSNTLFVGFREGASGSFKATYSDVTAAEAPDGRIFGFKTRLLANNQGDVFDVEIELRDHGGHSYVWDIDVPGYAGFETFELSPDDADFGRGSLSSDGTLEYRFNVDGELPDDRAAAIDMAQTTPFSVRSRDVGLSTSGVETTGRTITRRFDDSILSIIKTFTTEDGATAYVDENDVLYFETAGGTYAPVEITDETSTAVVDAEFDRDYDQIRNRVTVQGKGDLQATFENDSSIDFYGVAPREEPIIDKSLTTNRELETRGRGYLAENAWHDTAMTFTIANSDFRQVRPGHSLRVDWPPEGVNDEFTVTAAETTSEGYNVIKLSGNTTA